MKKGLRLILNIALCQIAGVFGSLFIDTGPGTWYASLAKPSFNPPGWVFAPVWITLYTLMGISLFMAWEKGPDRIEVREAAALFLVQLVLNAFWPFFFFKLQSPLAGFIVIVMLWTVLAKTIRRFSAFSRPAAILLMPYIGWVSFALLLNARLAMLNWNF